MTLHEAVAILNQKEHLCYSDWFINANTGDYLTVESPSFDRYEQPLEPWEAIAVAMALQTFDPDDLDRAALSECADLLAQAKRKHARQLAEQRAEVRRMEVEYQARKERESELRRSTVRAIAASMLPPYPPPR